jgi:hypothetical protein
MKDLSGLELDYPFGWMTITGLRDMSVHKRRVIKYLDEPVYLIENGYVLGIVKLKNERELSKADVLALYDHHKIPREQLEEWFPDVNRFYVYDIEVLERFDFPKKAKIERHGFPFVEKRWIEFAKLAGLSLKEALKIAEEKTSPMALLLASALTDLTPEDLEDVSEEDLANLEALARKLLSGEELGNVLAVLREAKEEPAPTDFLEVPSEKDGELVADVRPVLRILSKPAMIFHEAVSLVGSLAARGKGHDVDILIRSEIPDELFRRIAFRIGRRLNVLGVPVHILRDRGPFTTYIPLYDVWIIPCKSREPIEMAKRKILRPFTEVITMKPTRIGLGYPATKENFYKLVEENGVEGYLEPKYDGVCTYVHFKDGKMRAWTEDGQEITELIRDLFPKSPKEDVILCGELESWDGKQHMPREWTSGLVHSREKGPFSYTIWDVIYCDGSLQDLPFEERRKVLEALREEMGWEYREPKGEGGKVYVGRSYKVDSLGDIKKLMGEILKHTEYEGVVWKKKDGKWFLDGDSRGEQIKWHRNVTLKVVVVERNETKTKGVYNYLWGLVVEDPENWEPVQEVNGLTVHVCGKTFSTNLKFEPGDIMDLELETLTLERKENGKFRIGGWAPKIVKYDQV